MEKPTDVPLQANQELVERIQAASKVMRITDKDVCDRLKLLGIIWTEDDALDLLLSETTTEEDALKVFAGIPIARFRAGWALLKGRKTETQGDPTGEQSEGILKLLRPVDQWSDEDLINAYDQNCSTKIFTELRERSKNRRFVAFDENGRCNKKITLQLLRITRRQPIGETWQGDDGLVLKIYPAGEFPMPLVEECPFHEDIILVDGYCEKCMESWKGVTHPDRILARLAKPYVGDSWQNAMWISDLIKKLKTCVGNNNLNDNPLFSVKKAVLDYRELKEENRLPVLTRKLSQTRHGKSDPFHVHREY